MSKLTLSLPYPDSGLSPNARLNRWDKATLTYSSRVDGALAAEGWKGCIEQGCKRTLPVTVTFHPPDKRGRDLDNAYASMKAALDGVAQALGVNDKQFQPVTLKWGAKRKPGEVYVEIEA